ncbi:MAG: hypothetical protein V7K71_28180, partial [Nostoc sp.]|uniref:hypothetical protein n=1 Tax=Nostoc sp. TaxID=1180 RepID=UPI002FF9BC95
SVHPPLNWMNPPQNSVHPPLNWMNPPQNSVHLPLNLKPFPSLQPTIPNCDKLSQIGRGKNERHHQPSPRSQVWD